MNINYYNKRKDTIIPDGLSVWRGQIGDKIILQTYVVCTSEGNPISMFNITVNEPMNAMGIKSFIHKYNLELVESELNIYK